MLTLVDLFSGIGGFAMALRDIAKPLLYCEINGAARSVLRGAFRRGDLAEAPIVDDVKDLTRILQVVGGASVDILCAGFPCIGFSGFGHRRGLQNEASALLFDTLTAIDATRPRMVFLENVPNIMHASHRADFLLLANEFSIRGYELRWTVVSATLLGAPHIRKRWYALAVLRDADVTNVSRGPVDAPFIGRHVPPLTKRTDDARGKLDKRGAKQRVSMLGNAVIPPCARFAFERLFTGFQQTSDTSLRYCKEYGRPCGERIVRHGRCISADGELKFFEQPDAACVACVGFQIELRADQHTPPPTWVRQRSFRNVASSIVTDMTTYHFPTPRVSANSGSHVLTRRTYKDLATFVMFVTSFADKQYDKSDSKSYLNPEFVEYLMGYPYGHTAQHMLSPWCRM
jgi:DNA (cytosine-5)-methyltransferase 1